MKEGRAAELRAIFANAIPRMGAPSLTETAQLSRFSKAGN